MEENLVNMAKIGNKQAFEELVNLYQRKLYIIAQSKIEREEDIKDVIQDTLLQAYINIYSIKKADSFNGWITQILLNKCTNILRAQNKVMYSFDEMENEVCTDSEESFGDIEEKIDLSSVTSFLNENDKLVFMMHFSDGYTTKEISKKLHINENTIRTKIKRFRERVKEEYKIS